MLLDFVRSDVVHSLKNRYEQYRNRYYKHTYAHTTSTNKWNKCHFPPLSNILRMLSLINSSCTFLLFLWLKLYYFPNCLLLFTTHFSKSSYAFHRSYLVYVLYYLVADTDTANVCKHFDASFNSSIDFFA